MCELCEESGVISVEEYEAVSEDVCEYVPDDFEPDSVDEPLYQCPNPPEYCVVDSLVEEHLCDLHANDDPEDEADALLEAVGLGSAQILPIKPQSSEQCEHIDLINGTPECGESATHARVLEIESFLCAQHLKEYMASARDQRQEV